MRTLCLYIAPLAPLIGFTNAVHEDSVLILRFVTPEIESIEIGLEPIKVEYEDPGTRAPMLKPWSIEASLRLSIEVPNPTSIDPRPISKNMA